MHAYIVSVLRAEGRPAARGPLDVRGLATAVRAGSSTRARAWTDARAWPVKRQEPVRQPAADDEHPLRLSAEGG